MMLSALPIMSVNAASDTDIEQAIVDGLAFLAANQNRDGSWGGNVPYTAFVLIKLQDRAYELGKDPFETDSMDPDYYEYATNVIDGWEYIFTPAASGDPKVGQYAWKQTIDPEPAGDPDTNGNGYGISFQNQGYYIGICLMALVASGDPSHINEGLLDYNGDTNPDTFGEIAQDVVDYIAWSQGDTGTGRGGWRYTPNSGSSDNSVAGYVVLGLAAAEATTARPGATPFGCTVPGFVRTELNIWINYIQCASNGGSGYTSPCSWVNELKTGNLIFQMTFYGDSTSSARFQNALSYIENNWQVSNTDPGWGYNCYPAEYQAMYCLMKGLTYSGITLIDTDGDSIRDDDWFNQEPPAAPAQDFASVLVAQQNADGSWPACLHSDAGRILSTAWALLTLEAISVEPPTRYPTDDSYTDQRIKYRNYGTASTLWAYNKPYPIDRYMWLKFDLGGIPSGATATLYLHPHSSYGSPRTCDRTFGAHFSSDDTWDETTITWNNQPGFNAAPESTVTNPVRCTPIAFDVTSIVQSEIAAGEQYISFVIKSEEHCWMDYLCAYSSDHPDNTLWPYLDIS